MICREIEQVYPTTNLAALIRRFAAPKVTEATVAEHLSRAQAGHQSKRLNGYEYLRGIDPALCHMADEAGLFERDLDTQGARFLVSRIARSFIESRENGRRGFEGPKVVPLPSGRQIDAPPPMTDEQREANKARISSILQGLGRGGAA